jgi:hypothetical protein
VPVADSHSETTILLLLLSKTWPKAPSTDEEVEELTVRVRNAGTKVVEAKAACGAWDGDRRSSSGRPWWKEELRAVRRGEGSARASTGRLW